MTERTKTSVRLDADVVEIIASYANTFTNGDKTKALNELVRATQSAQATPDPPINNLATQSHPEPPKNDLLDKAVLEIEDLKTRISEIEQKLDKPQVNEIATHLATLEVGDMTAKSHPMIAKSHPLHNTLMNSEYVEQECKLDRKKHKLRWYQSLGLIVVAQERYDQPIFDVLAKVDPGSPITIDENGGFLYQKSSKG